MYIVDIPAHLLPFVKASCALCMVVYILSISQPWYILTTLVESETLVRTFIPGSTLELGLKAFRRRGRNSLGLPPTFYSWLVLPTETQRYYQLLFRVSYWRQPLVLGGVSTRD
jgi:hypothetical protein